jgi:DNA-binding NtrC family response regulator
VNARLLIVDDEEAFTLPLTRYLNRSGFLTDVAPSLRGARGAIQNHQFQGVLLDLALPDGNGLDWISELRATLPDVAIVVITGTDEVRIAVEAMRRGADHYVTKPVDLADLELFLRKSLEVGMLRRRTAAQQRIARPAEMFIGRSTPAQRAIELARVAAESDVPVLVTGETGTGKGVLSRWIHQESARRSMPFVEVNCSILRGELLASELFGHARGAFTSAVDHRAGLLDAADGGTLFLDEIGDMDLTVQSQFLKAIEEKTYRRLGEVQGRQSDFRLICATNRDLASEIAAARFRQDLYYRIHLLPIAMPPLREMRADFGDLVRYLLRALRAHETLIEEKVFEKLVAYGWPGNIRELKNVLERALLLSRSAPIGVEHLPGLNAPTEAADVDGELSRILETLERLGGDKEQAARELGISRATLYRRLQRPGTRARLRHSET